VLECGSRFWAVDGGALYTINEAGVAYCSQPVLYGSPDVTAIEASAFTEFGASFVYVRTAIPSHTDGDSAWTGACPVCDDGLSPSAGSHPIPTGQSRGCDWRRWAAHSRRRRTLSCMWARGRKEGKDRTDE
jgi:hypothetical protein